jgi:hypothetical protein
MGWGKVTRHPCLDANNAKTGLDVGIVTARNRTQRSALLRECLSYTEKGGKSNTAAQVHHGLNY